MTITTPSEIEYLKLVCGPALRTEQLWQIPAPATVAQAIIEGNGQVNGQWVWGSSPLVTLGNNPFGIKYVHKIGEDYAENELVRLTPEVVGMQRQMILQPFRKFPNLEAAFDAHAQLLRFAPRYALAMQSAADWKAFAVGIMMGGYSTDRPPLCQKPGCTHYAGEIEMLVTEHRLDDYTVLAGYAAMPEPPKTA